jgi:hypothetical protein
METCNELYSKLQLIPACTALRSTQFKPQISALYYQAVNGMRVLARLCNNHSYSSCVIIEQLRSFVESSKPPFVDGLEHPLSAFPETGCRPY